MPDDLLRLKDRALDVLAVSKHGGTFTLVFHNSEVKTILKDGEDITTDIAAPVGAHSSVFGLHPAEVSFGTAHVDPVHIDWSRNAGINEGVVGVHIGLGDGGTGAHVDFVAPLAEIRFESHGRERTVTPRHHPLTDVDEILDARTRDGDDAD